MASRSYCERALIGAPIAFSPIERYFRDVRLFRLYEGTSQIHQLNIAKLMLRESA